MRNPMLAMLLLVVVPAAHAQSSILDSFTLRLAKTPDLKDTEKPATVGFQRNDGGKNEYITQGAFKLDFDFGAANATTFSPNISWNHNTLASTPTNNWSVALGLKHRIVANEKLDTWVFSGSLGGQEDTTKSSTSTVAKASLNWFGWPEWKRAGSLDYWAIRPTLTVFSKHVSNAAPDKVTGIVPTGTLAGGLIALDAQAQLGRWTFSASTQALRPTSVVNGDTKRTHHLHSASITYQFVDSPTTGTAAKASQWIPGITLMRQVGDDPLNTIPKAGFTQLAFSLRY